MASGSTLVAMLDGHASVFLQVAEYKESTKCGSFTALSSSLGQILMQLHTGMWKSLVGSAFIFVFILKAEPPFLYLP